ncbi:ribosomal-protein-alanine N-acetyltransferase [Arcanobacterium pluranimalium]|uniref:GNAT family N-acetyltransferase n=1 Tax=Arcanobacterium pluranimalium TaxID=108028 RepID=UPI00195CDD0B|nr:GNAT family N-acetyltransferase [Arcanobacterium pluranimalium]MBM7824984.1 ribosomal-protein-alanine N-acetyltransferase [Arcanobacterium pluranimalium]
MALPENSSIIEVPAGWVERCARFDLRNFGRDAWPIDVWKDELVASDRSYYAVVCDAQPHESVGALLAIAGISHGPDAELLTIGVDAAYRRRGIARELLAFMLDIPRSRQADRVFLEVRKADAGAQALYKAFGFEPISVRKKYYSDDDAVVMRLAL